MTPGKYDLSLYRGDSYIWQVRLWEDSSKLVPVDLVGATAESEIRFDKVGGAVVMALDCAITEPNIIDVALTAAMWVPAVPLSGAWDLEVTFPDGEVRTFLAGRVAVAADVTNAVTA